jgi:thymidylate kinase
MIPNPDLVFVLDAPTEVIYSRKQELSPEEIDRQRLKFIKISEQLKNAHLINTNQPINDVVKQVTKIIIDKKVNQTAKKMYS